MHGKWPVACLLFLGSACTHVSIHMHTCTSAYIYICTYMYVCTCMCCSYFKEVIKQSGPLHRDDPKLLEALSLLSLSENSLAKDGQLADFLLQCPSFRSSGRKGDLICLAEDAPVVTASISSSQDGDAATYTLSAGGDDATSSRSSVTSMSCGAGHMQQGGTVGASVSGPAAKESSNELKQQQQQRQHISKQTPALVDLITETMKVPSNSNKSGNANGGRGGCSSSTSLDVVGQEGIRGTPHGSKELVRYPLLV